MSKIELWKLWQKEVLRVIFLFYYEDLSMD